MSRSDSDNTNAPKCTFCKKTKTEVDQFLKAREAFTCTECSTTNDAFVCNGCAKELIKVFEEVAQHKALHQTKEGNTQVALAIPTPKEIDAFLSQWVIGQSQAKKTLAVAAYNHYKRIALLKKSTLDIPPSYEETVELHPSDETSKSISDETEIFKSNLLIIGPTGSGKTLLAQALADKLSLPFTIVDVTTLTEAGYVGEDVENILQRLLQAANGDITSAQMGVVYLDEIDKLSRRSDNPSITRDVSGEGVQQALLKLLEGTVASVPLQGSRKHPHQETVLIDTKNILFICGGTFAGLEKIIRERTERSGIGFSAEIQLPSDANNLNKLIARLEPEDLVKYGLIPELIGRLPIITHLEELTEEQLVEVLTKPKNALINQYIKLFKINQVDLSFEQEALFAIAKKALTRKTGARGLRAILESHLLDLMYNLPSETNIAQVIITQACILEKASPTLIYKTDTDSSINSNVASNE